MNKTADAMRGTEHDLTIVREFNASPDLVFDLWSKPEHALQWMGPRDYPAVEFEQDLREGGKWRGCLKAGPDSHAPGELLWQGGEFRQITPPEKLVFTFQWEGGPETVITVLFTAVDVEKTRMVFHQTPFADVDNRDGHVGGWNSSFDRLAELLSHIR